MGYNEVNNSNKKIFENEYMKEIENDNIQQKKKIEQMQLSYKLLSEGLKAQNEKENSTDMEPRKKGKTRILWRKRYLEETKLLRKENEKVLKEKEQRENELKIIKKKMAEM